MNGPTSKPVAKPGSPSRVPEVLGVNVALTGLVVLTVALRVFTRVVIVRKFQIDDGLIIFAAGLTIYFGVQNCIQTRYGFGYHMKDLIHPENFSKALRLFLSGEVAYYTAVGVTKMSLLILYLRLFQTKQYVKLRWLSWVLLVLTTCLTVCWIFLSLFQCTPISYYWDRTIPGGHCISAQAVFFTHAGINIMLDMIIYIMPIGMLWRVNIPFRERIGLVAVFACGTLVFVMGIVRLPSLQKTSVSHDTSWLNVSGGNWTTIEVSIGVVCASLPTLKPLLRLWSRHIRAHTDSYIPYSDGNYSSSRRYISKLGSQFTVCPLHLHRGEDTFPLSTGGSFPSRWEDTKSQCQACNHACGLSRGHSIHVGHGSVQSRVEVGEGAGPLNTVDMFDDFKDGMLRMNVLRTDHVHVEVSSADARKPDLEG